VSAGSAFVAGGEAFFAGRLIVANGCLALRSGDSLRPVVWHAEARLAEDGRRVLDTRTGKSVGVGEIIALEGALHPRPSAAKVQDVYSDLPDSCAGSELIVVGRGFHE
jgi:hypothetical protein